MFSVTQVLGTKWELSDIDSILLPASDDHMIPYKRDHRRDLLFKYLEVAGLILLSPY